MVQAGALAVVVVNTAQGSTSAMMADEVTRFSSLNKSSFYRNKK